jgi:hypothetical protein
VEGKMAKIKEKVIEEIKLLPEDFLEPVLDFVEYLKLQKNKVGGLESRYGSFQTLESKVMSREHSWEEEKDFFEWESAVTEVEKIKRILKLNEA